MIADKPRDEEMNIEIVTPRFSATFLDDLVEYHMRKVAPLYRKFDNLYRGKVKIYKKRRTDGKEKPNNKLANDFYGQIVDDTVGYFLGNPISIGYTEPTDDKEVGRNTAEADVGVDLEEVKGSDTAVQDELNGIFSDNYKDDLFMEWGKQSIIKGVSHLLVYQDEESNTRIIKLKPEDVITVYKNSSTKEAEYKIRLYKISTEDTDKTTLWAEVYSKDKIEVFKQVDSTVQGAQGKSGFVWDHDEPHIYGRIPIITLYNNEEEMSDLEKIETLVNDYDRVMSDISDEFEAFRNAYLVIKDMVMNGDSLQKLKEEGIVEVTDSGDMRFVTKEIQTDALNSHLERLERNIHKFAQVPDLSDENFASNLSGVAIRFKLFGLETKCIIKERKMDKAIRQLLEVLSVPIRVKTGKEIDLRQVKIEFSRNIPMNITEIVDTVCKLEGKVDKETLLALLPFVDDPLAVLEKLKKDQEEAKKENDPYSLQNSQNDAQNLFPNLNQGNTQGNSFGGLNGAQRGSEEVI
jgi:SPP1 family phage portal protein